MSRRLFLGSTVGAMAMRHPLARLRPARERTIVLDLEDSCCLRESLAGYESALGPRVMRSDAASLPRCDTLIVPAAVRIPPAACDAIRTCLDDGGRVILESGAGFANDADFSAHRTALREAFDLRIEPPVDLWPQSYGAAIPYVEYTWPRLTSVRDFSRATPLAGAANETIARVNGHVVGIRRRLGPGTLIVLGSPLGPALWAGDAEAVRWLHAATARPTA